MRVIYISRAQVIRSLVVIILVIASIIYTQTTEYDAISVFLNTKRELPIYSVETEEKKIAISFDAAWGAEYTDEILEILKKRNIKTTFFLVGFWVDKYPEKVRRIASEGHEIGNHSTTHPHMSQLSSQQIQMEIETTQKKIEALAGDRAVKLFRPPFGDYNDRLILTCREMGYYPIQWDVEAIDTKVKHGIQRF